MRGLESYSDRSGSELTLWDVEPSGPAIHGDLISVEETAVRRRIPVAALLGRGKFCGKHLNIAARPGGRTKTERPGFVAGPFT